MFECSRHAGHSEAPVFDVGQDYAPHASATRPTGVASGGRLSELGLRFAVSWSSSPPWCRGSGLYLAMRDRSVDRLSVSPSADVNLASGPSCRSCQGLAGLVSGPPSRSVERLRCGRDCCARMVERLARGVAAGASRCRRHRDRFDRAQRGAPRPFQPGASGSDLERQALEVST